MKKVVCILLLLLAFSSFAQTKTRNLKTINVQIVSDTIKIDSVSINPINFKVFVNDKLIDSLEYKVDFAKALLIINSKKYEQITIQYQAFPEFLTKTYRVFDENIIVPKRTSNSKLYSANSKKKNSFFKPFDGLNTSGSLSRGFTVGNNQDAVLNSNLDLQISGNLSNNLELRASITDTNVPLQEGGFTQRLNEFDRVFIELLSKNWSAKAGDLNLKNTNSRFLNFNKKIAGIEVNATLNHANSNTKVFASGAIVRGQFARNAIIAQEANQGPYRITGNNNEQIVLLISGSETVYVNGTPLRRGERYDYIINYNTGELTFNPTYPINANMRIIVEYQFTDRNYTRFVTYDGFQHESDNFSIGLNFYNENDAKNQTSQQDLTDTQRGILLNAGDNRDEMIVPSAIAQPFEENSIQYKKEIVNGAEIFVFSNDENDNLFNVRFSFVGLNQGDYRISNTVGSGRIYEFIAPINGVSQGDYEPVIQLIAPNKLQITTLNASYVPSKKTTIKGEIAYSTKDENLFSSLNDDDNSGIAGSFSWEQLLIDKPWKLSASANFELINNNFRTIERFRNIEFNRDWDLINPLGNQRYLKANISYENEKKGTVSYALENLIFSENFKGLRHNYFSNLNLKNTHINAKGSFLSNDNDISKTEFLRFYSTVKQHFKTAWIGAKFNAEHNNRKEIDTDLLSPINHKFIAYEAFAGIGDTAKVYTEIGYNYRTTDSIRSNSFQNINSTNTLFMRSKLVQSKNTDLSVFASYRTINNTFLENEKALNSRVLYRQNLFNNTISLNTGYETNSGSLPQQEFSYVEVESGQGFYTWIDYNENGIQELDEFEVAQFTDEAIYLRVALPTTKFIKTNQNKFSQTLILNGSNMTSPKGFSKFLSHFVNQSSVLIDSKNPRNGSNFSLNPFRIQNALALTLNFRNSLYFNRGKQKYSTTYTYLDTRNKSAFTFATQENNLKSHQLQFIHRIGKFWLFDAKTIATINESGSDNFSNRNYRLYNKTFTPKISYILNKNARFEFSYTYKNKENRSDDFEMLRMNSLGTNMFFSNKQQFSLNLNANVFFNDFIGNQNSPVAFQMLEGLQSGTNYTWNLNFQKRITSYLDINLNYLGRKSPTSRAVHTGTIQLRATF